MSTHIALLPDRGWIRLTGEDALDFLHDQVSAELKSLDEARVQPAAYCSPKGRVLAILKVSKWEGGLLAELPAELVEGISQRLAMFVLRADVNIQSLQDRAAFGVWGEPGRVLEVLGLDLPDQDFASARTGDLSACRLPGGIARVQVSGPDRAVADAWRTAASVASRAGAGEWTLQDIAAGLPEVLAANSDRFLPQSLALDEWSAVNYRKGCYPGQEVIARMHYRGQLKRHLYRATVPGQPPEPGALVRSSEGSEAGAVVVSAATPGKGNSSLLAVLRDGSVDGCRLADDEARPLESPQRVAPPQK